MIVNLDRRTRRIGCLRAVLGSVLMASQALVGQAQPDSATASFPEMTAFLARVVKHQKEVESLITQYTFTDTTTLYTLDKKGRVRSQHTDTYYITPTAYEIFVLHVKHDGKPVSEQDLKKQQEEIERKLRRDEEKAQKPGALRPKNTLLFADIIANSRFTPLRWEESNGRRLAVYAFEAKSVPERTGDLMARVAADMKGTMWISPEEAEIVRVDFASAAPISLGMGILGNVKGFEGYVEQKKVHSEVWLPSHQEFVASGRDLVKGFHIRQVSEFSDYLKAGTDVFQQIHAPKAGANDASQMLPLGGDHD